jgi:hypothetical protein
MVCTVSGYTADAIKTGCGQFYILDSAEAPTRRPENQTDQGLIVEIIQQ